MPAKKRKKKSTQEERPQILLIVRSLVLDRGKLLLIQREPKERWASNLWEFPGGKLDKDQDVSHALESEVLEETGLLVTALSRTAFIESKVLARGPYAGMPYVAIVGVSKVVGGKVKLSDEHQAFRWVTANQAFKMKLTEEARKALIALQSKIGINHFYCLKDSLCPTQSNGFGN